MDIDPVDAPAQIHRFAIDHEPGLCPIHSGYGATRFSSLDAPSLPASGQTNPAASAPVRLAHGRWQGLCPGRPLHQRMRGTPVNEYSVDGRLYLYELPSYKHEFDQPASAHDRSLVVCAGPPEHMRCALLWPYACGLGLLGLGGE